MVHFMFVADRKVRLIFGFLSKDFPSCSQPRSEGVWGKWHGKAHSSPEILVLGLLLLLIALWLVMRHAMFAGFGDSSRASSCGLPSSRAFVSIVVPSAFLLRVGWFFSRPLSITKHPRSLWS